MKQLITVSLIVMILILSGCKGQESSASDYYRQEIIRCLDSDDHEALKALFCKTIQNTQTIDSEIDTAFNLWDGVVESYHADANGGVKSIRKGEIDYWSVRSHAQNVITNSGKQYTISYLFYLANKASPNSVGLAFVSVQEGETLLFEIGADLYISTT